MAEQDMTVEELQELERYLMAQQTSMDPFGAALNQYGPGAGYLDMEDEPLAWQRMDDFDARLTDTLKLAQMYLPDLVDLPYQEVEDPGEYDGFVNFNGAQVAGNPAFQMVQAAMNDPQNPVSYDEAVNLVIRAAQNPDDPDSPALYSALPQDEDGNLRADAFRSGARDVLFDANREGMERGEYDALKAQYEDYVRPRTQLDFMPVPDAPEYATGFESPNQTGWMGSMLDRWGIDGGPRRNAGPAQPNDLPTMIRNAVENTAAGNAYSGRQEVDGQLRNAPNTSRPQSRRQSGPQRPRLVQNSRGEWRTNPNRDVQRDSQGRSGSDIVFDQNRNMNKGTQNVLGMIANERQKQQVQSKERENQAAILQALAQLRYGGAL